MRAMRLQRRADIERVRHGGEMRSDRLFTLRARPNGLEVVRLAVASPRALGGAVRRNRARRRVREAVRTLLAARVTARGMDLFVVTRPPALEAPPEALRTAVARQLDALFDARSGGPLASGPGARPRRSAPRSARPGDE